MIYHLLMGHLLKSGKKKIYKNHGFRSRTGMTGTYPYHKEEFELSPGFVEWLKRSSMEVPNRKLMMLTVNLEDFPASSSQTKNVVVYQQQSRRWTFSLKIYGYAAKGCGYEL